MVFLNYSIRILMITFVSILLGCGGKVAINQSETIFTASVVGLSGNLVLQNNLSDNYIISTSGQVSIPFFGSDQQAYSLTILSPPDNQTCFIGNSSGIIDKSGTSIEITCSDISLVPLYDNASNWMDYVKNDGDTNLSATNVVCDGSESGTKGYLECLHGGEMRSVAIFGYTSCTNISAVDSLNAFNWICNDSQNPIRIISTGLNQKYLSDLIDDSSGIASWKNISLDIMDGDHSTVGRIAASSWWSNPIALQSVSGTTLNTSGTIYWADADPSSNLIISNDKVALVVKPGVILTSQAGGGDIVTASANFVWVEGTIDANNGDNTNGIRIPVGTFGVFKNLTISNAHGGSAGIGTAIYGQNSYSYFGNLVISNSGYNGIHLSSNGYNTFENVVISGSGSSGLYANTHRNDNYSNLRVLNSGAYGIYFYDSRNSILYDVIVANNGAGGIFFDNVGNTRAQNVVSANNVTYGIWETPCSGGSNIFSNVTVINNNSTGVYNYHNDDRSYRNMIIVNHNNGYGFDNHHLYDYGILDNIVVAHNPNHSALYLLHDLTYVTGLAKFGDILANFEGGNSGLSSDFSLTEGITMANSFVGKAGSDSENSSDSLGSAESAVITDWTSFENFYRFWGAGDSAAFPSANHGGRCTGADECQIWDVSLKVGDTGDGGNPVALDVLSLPTGDNTLVQAWLESSLDACSLIPGGTWGAGICRAPGYSDQATCEDAGFNWTTNRCYTKHLRNSVEIMGDELGNENTLCETGETCLFTPNIGAYQGHGSLISAGDFTNGSLTGITLMKYQNNGR